MPLANIVNMSTRSVSPRLRASVREAVESQGLTWRDIQDAGGPSPATMSKIVGDVPMRVTPATCRKLDAGLGWPEGAAWRACGEPSMRSADVERELDRIISEARVLLDRLRKAESGAEKSRPRSGAR